jgi:hypothetical protein
MYKNMPDARIASANRTAGNDEGSELVVRFSELEHCDTVDDGSGGDDYTDQVAIYRLNGHNSRPNDYDKSTCPDNNPINTVEAYSRAYDVSVCVSITGTSADDLEAGVAQQSGLYLYWEGRTRGLETSWTDPGCPLPVPLFTAIADAKEGKRNVA